MSKKYLSLEEAASVLRVAPEELVRMRERGDIRGFADRGAWKFRDEDVQNLLRSRQADSDPEVPLMADPDADSAIGMEDDVGEQPTVIRKGDVGEATSDSDIQLVDAASGSAVFSDDDLILGSDSEVKLVGEGSALAAESGIDLDSPLPLSESGVGPGSEVASASLDSDSDVQLVDQGSESDVVLVPDQTEGELSLDSMAGSDSDVRLVEVPGKSDADRGSESDVALLSDDDDAIPLDFTPGEGEAASVLSDESGIALSGDDSAMLLASESGISLEGPSDSGIALDSDDEGITLDIAGDSGIALETAADSGISLESIADSGISLEGDDFSGTMPMMDALQSEDTDETAFEIPALSSDDSEFELTAVGSSDEADVLDLEDAEASLDDGVFDLDESETDEFAEVDEFGDDDLDVADDILGEDDELDDLDVFDADEDVFDEGLSPAGQKYASPVGYAPVEQEWGAGTFASLLVSTVLLVLVGLVMFDLVHNIWAWNDTTPVSKMLLDALGGLYK